MNILVVTYLNFDPKVQVAVWLAYIIILSVSFNWFTDFSCLTKLRIIISFRSYLNWLGGLEFNLYEKKMKIFSWDQNKFLTYNNRDKSHERPKHYY